MILDCRTTRPDNIKVSLLIKPKQVSRLPYKFDPRVGVIVEDLKGFPNQTQIEEIICLNNYSAFDKLSFKHSGQYVCTISALNLFESNVKNIEVKVNIVQFVKFKDKNDSMVHKKIVKDGEDFLWDMQFEGYPRNLIYTFYNPYGDLFLHKDKRANASYVYEEGKLSLSIKKVTVEDFGNYSARLEAPNGSYDETYVMLVVNGKPKVRFSEIPSVLPSDKNFTITLFILAFHLNKPEPDVSCFLGSNCSIRFDFCRLTQISNQSYRLEKDFGPPNRYKLVLSLLLPSSRMLYCDVFNGNDVGM
ncbi:hypothetical protein Anas_13004, partial [Armadillidium nasatum]